MDKMAYKPDEALGRLPELLEALLHAPALDIRGLTLTKVVEALPADAGVYLFSHKADDTPVYVGRSASLWQRVGTNHRSTQENQAPLTTALQVKYQLPTMKDAREYLFENYVVRLLAEADVVSRALLEIYAATVLNTEFNSFIEH